MYMENFDEVIFDDDEFGGDSFEQTKPEDGDGNQPSNGGTPSGQQDEDLTTEVLRLKVLLTQEKLNSKMKLVLLQKELGTH